MDVAKPMPHVTETNDPMGEHGLVKCDHCSGNETLCRACTHNLHTARGTAERSEQRLRRINIALELIEIGHDAEALTVLREVD